MANTKISQLTANTNPSGSEELVYASNGTNGKMSLNTMKGYVENNLSGFATTGDLTTGLAGKQDTLVSGTNIRTINGTSILGSGNITIQGGGGQTQYDYSAMQGPCPAGYHIPQQSEGLILYNTMVALGISTSNGDFSKYLKIPLGGYRAYNQSGAPTQNVGLGSFVGYSTATSTNTTTVFTIGASSVNYANTMYRAMGISIRPFKDTAVIPDNTWTELFDGSLIAQNAGIFHDTVNEIISISSNGVDWLTIADKNLGATVVWNYGDTPSASNSGYFYQWGNNNGFAGIGGSVTTSATQVNAGTYGPGNYYSSSTFITNNRDWSNTQNDNLWGGVTGPVPVTSGGITELTADANIWELSEGTYVTEHDLYYTTGNKVRFYIAGGGSGRQMLFVVNQSGRGNAFFVYNVGHNSQYTRPRCSYGYSKSSSEGETHLLREWDASLQEYAIVPGQTDIDAIGSGGGLGFTQLINDAEDNQSLRVAGTVYSGVTYTIVVNSVAAGQTYSVTLGTGVTNPLNITLPNLSNKKCVITLVATSASTAIVSGCTMGS